MFELASGAAVQRLLRCCGNRRANPFFVRGCWRSHRGALSSAGTEGRTLPRPCGMIWRESHGCLHVWVRVRACVRNAACQLYAVSEEQSEGVKSFVVNVILGRRDDALLVLYARQLIEQIR